MQLSGCSAADVEAQFLQDFEMKRVDTDYLHDLLVGIEVNKPELTEIFSAKLDRTCDELDPIERAVLWIGTFELAHRIDVPFKVSIDESVELAKQFGAAESHRLVNSVLDALAKELRTVERQSLQER